MPKYSILITEGFQKSYVPIDEVIKKLLGELGGTTAVAELPDTGESGKIYYNTSDGKYYTYSNDAFKELGGSGVIQVESLPGVSDAQEGAIYYNTETGIHYLFDGANFTELNTSVMPVRRVTGTSTALNYGVNILPNHYNIITIPEDIAHTQDPSTTDRPFAFVFTDVPDTATAGQYVGRFTAISDDQAISLHSDNLEVSIHWPDDVPDIVEGHTYEFNVLYDTCLLTDITTTATSQSEDEPAPAEPTSNP